jgi:hypothetical protein
MGEGYSADYCKKQVDMIIRKIDEAIKVLNRDFSLMDFQNCKERITMENEAADLLTSLQGLRDKLNAYTFQ